MHDPEGAAMRRAAAVFAGHRRRLRRTQTLNTMALRLLSLPLLILTLAVAQSSSSFLLDDPELDNELVSEFDYALDGARTFSFNSTYLLVAVAVGAVLVLAVGVGLYFYDLYVDTGRTEPIPESYDYAQYYQQQYQNAEQAYPAAAQYQYQYRRWVGGCRNN